MASSKFQASAQMCYGAHEVVHDAAPGFYGIKAPDCSSIPMPIFCGSLAKSESSCSRMRQFDHNSEHQVQCLLREVAHILLQCVGKTSSTWQVARDLSVRSTEFMKAQGLRLGAVLRCYRKDFLVDSKGKMCTVCYLHRELKAVYMWSTKELLVSL
eukprot:TRINITY_DN66060_c0_g1_i1.p1 TRINITY_DN66060_c0_g1~~TRINITY_DN66060_c0_g1_i1.p1  ORF type:complete len:180 (-),score=17.95 TRINITY_DN66060_c0_g1_i1:121-588(-)